MKSKRAHITIDGEPICKRSWLMDRHGITCGHVSLTSANKAKRELQRHIWWKRVKVIPGECPV